MKLYIEKRISKASGKPFWGLYADLGYTQRGLNFEQATIAELTDKTMRELSEAPVGQRIELTT